MIYGAREFDVVALEVCLSRCHKKPLRSMVVVQGFLTPNAPIWAAPNAVSLVLPDTILHTSCPAVLIILP